MPCHGLPSVCSDLMTCGCCLLYVCINLCVVCLPTAYDPLLISGWLVMLCLQFLLIHVCLCKMVGLIHEEDILALLWRVLTCRQLQPKRDMFLCCLDHHRPHSSRSSSIRVAYLLTANDVSLLTIMIIEVWFVRYPKKCCVHGCQA